MLNGRLIIASSVMKVKWAPVVFTLAALFLSLQAGRAIANQETTQLARLVGFAVVIILGIVTASRPAWGPSILLWVVYLNEVLFDLLPSDQIFSAGKFIGFVVFVVWLASSIMKGNVRIHLGKSGWLLLGMLFQMLLSAWANGEFKAQAFLLMSTGLILYVLIVNLVIEKRDFDLFITNLIAIAAVVAFLGFVAFWEAGFQVRMGFGEEGLLRNVNELPFFLNIVLPFVLVSAVRSSHWRRGAQILVVFLLLVIATSSSRAGVLTSAGILFVLGLRYASIRWVALVSAGLIVVLSPYVYTISIFWDRLLNPAAAPKMGALYSLYGRQNALRAGIDLGLAHPLFGIGPLVWRDLFPFQGVGDPSTYVPSSPHNTYLQAFAELGFPGLILLLALLGLSVGRLWRLFRNRMKYEASELWLWAMWALVLSYVVSINSLNHLYGRDLFIVLGMVEAYCNIVERKLQPLHGSGGERKPTIEAFSRERIPRTGLGQVAGGWSDDTS